MHPLVNADYLGLGIVAAWLPAPLVFFLYFLLLLNEIVVNLAPIYHFSVGEFLTSAQYLMYLNHWMVLKTGLTVFAVAFMATWAAMRIGRGGSRKVNAIVLLVAAVVICSLDILNGTSFLQTGIGISIADVNLAYSGVRRTAMSLASALEKQDAVFIPLTADQADTGRLFEKMNLPDFSAKTELQLENVVLVVVESMGKFADEPTQALLFRRFLSDARLRAKYDIKMSAVPFHGSTIHGEFRELCHVNLQVYGDHLPSPCLPTLFSKLGYESVAFHGFTNQFYQRYKWYPKLGFNRIYFAEELRSLGIGRSCGASFTGICDQDVIKKIREELVRGRSGDRPRFIHWMTLNSHLPIFPGEGEDSTLDCSKSPVLASDSTLCAYSHLVDKALEGVVDLAEDPDLLPTRFFIVGDHAPPFQNPERRGKFDVGDITGIELVPKVAR
jgi:hypothetical protein